MYLRHESALIINHLLRLQKVIIDLAKTHLDTILPGYTHTQRAQPILLSHHLMAYFEMFSRDIERLENCWQRINVMPLGCAALAGTTFPIDRKYTAELLGFDAVSANSIDAVSDRDFIIEFLAVAAICMVHFSRLSEELILWSTTEFNFIELPDAYATGSSIMPQKKNPDVPELVRGKTGTVIGNLTTLLTLMKSLPLAYNRDMQEDKMPLFSAVDTLTACIEIYVAMLPEIKFNKKNMQRAAASGFQNATDLADYLTHRGLPFREAHHVVGKAVRFAMDQKKELHELSLQELQSFSGLIKQDIYNCLSSRQIVERRTSYGGTGGKMVSGAIKEAEKWLDQKKTICDGPMSSDE
jgi:argininosuccinate lyase